MRTNKENKLRIKQEYEKLTEQTFIEDYIMIVFDSADDWNKVNSKKINLKIKIDTSNSIFLNFYKQ